MQHQIYPDRFNDDGEFVPAVIVEVPDILYLQVVDEGDCEDWPAPSEPDERTFSWERINASDVTYAPLARAEAEAAELRAELDAARAELGTLRKRINIVMNQAAIQCDDGNWNYSDYMRGLANGLLLAKSDLDNSPYLPLARPERWLEEVAGRQWRPNDDQALFEDKDIEGEIILTATFLHGPRCWNVDGISILASGVVAWRPRTAAPDDGGEEVK